MTKLSTMTIIQALRYYLRSTTHLLSVGVAGAGIVLSAVFGVGIPVIPLIIAAYAVITVALIFSKRGAEEILREKEEEVTESGRQKMADAAELRKRIEVIRIPDEKVIKEVQHYLLVSGIFFERAGQAGRYFPAAVDNVAQVLSACNSYLSKLDEASTSARYGTKPEKTHDELVSDTAAFIREAALGLNELRRIELPDSADLDNMMRLHPPEG